MRTSDLAIPARLGRIGRVGPTLGGAPRWFALAVVVSIIAAVRLPATAVTAPAVLPLLVALAAGCVLALAIRRAPSLAWLAATAGSFAAASVPIAVASRTDPGEVGLAAWLTWAVPAGLAAFATLWIAAGYATRPEPRIDGAGLIAAVLVAWFATAVGVTIAAVVAGGREDPAFTWVDVASIPIAWFRPFLALLTALGAMGDVRAAARRARVRSSPDAGPWEIGATTIRELVPGQVAAEESRAAAERRRIAGDLHASVVPRLRRAIEEAEDGGDPSTVLRHLRAADLELERLMADRWPVVLETFGLVPALEDLAERLEDDGSPPIALEIGPMEGRPPAIVERAAWRVAQVALENVVRHAVARSVTVTIASAPGRLGLVVADDGRGFEPAAATRVGARGLADAAAQAAAVGATFRVESGASGGTTARFEWVVRGAS